MAKNAGKNYFFALIPDLSGLLDELQKLQGIKNITTTLPLHLTLFYFGELNPINNKRVDQYFARLPEKLTDKITLQVRGIDSFKDGQGKDTVFFLTVDSENVRKIHQELFSLFHDIHTDTFDFVPHISLAFPQKGITQQNVADIHRLFSGVHELSCNQFALASVDGQAIQVEKALLL
ncbi:MAG: hypothetical protein A2V81_04340 [Candidatus Abawacabacteria bacterium RBG_16_42_10]|uniref:2'-5' RNA ligase n=1 Tax=Candidatus Abawacabacteria bacterium RBG_16_42_10 TaxID=1817814 RepID=A0A1F4XJK9_9BACT|nr:MAG: hypothetical protein A2V81_04340 [Candidatus Abawacabacteria bacterium RBG_16_42_10]